MAFIIESKSQERKTLYKSVSIKGIERIVLDSTSPIFGEGTYFGSKINSQGKVFHYRFNFTYTKDERGLVFFSTTPIFSIRPGYITDGNYDFYPDKKSIPAILKGPMTFLGKFKGDSLEIIRTTNEHLFSSGDSYTFIKTDYLGN